MYILFKTTINSHRASGTLSNCLSPLDFYFYLALTKSTAQPHKNLFLHTIAITRQIAIGGRNKYLIHGKVAQLSMVQNLFHSVQLNINNPNFLIMQGRITKVVNMKPPEILSMIDETAGTRMYQSKKESALKTIEKMDAKVQEIDRILKEEITPSLERLRKERLQYMQWSAKPSEAEKLSRLVVAIRYTRARQKTMRVDEEAAEMQNQMK
jgi:structural maintenance of chromosome 2